MKEIKFSVAYDGGTARDGMLNLYDASEAINGLARSLAITTNAFLNNGQLRTHGERAKGAQLYLNPAKKGCFEETVSIFIEDKFAKNIGPSIISKSFWDFISWTWSAAVGIDYSPETAYVRDVMNKNDLFINEIANILESSIKNLHRPIHTEKDISLDIIRPKVGTILVFSKETLDYVTTRDETDPIRKISSNVTKYNVLTGYGRIFDDNSGKTIPFNLDDSLSPADREHLTWSLDQRNRGHEGKLLVDVIQVVNAHGQTVRYRLLAAGRK